MNLRESVSTNLRASEIRMSEMRGSQVDNSGK